MFSENYGYKPKRIFQTENIDDTLKNDIWNTIQKHFLNEIFYYHNSYNLDPYAYMSLYQCNNSKYIFRLYEDFFKKPLHNLRDQSLYKIKDEIYNFYKNFQWYEVYDFIEFISSLIISKDFVAEINQKLERNNSAYRLVSNSITPITNNEELQIIEDSTTTKFKVVNTHINKAITLLSDKLKPDFENTIKESITAVEAMCSIMVGKNATLGETLDLLEKNKIQIHPALKSSFNKLYGYTSDGNGIRHSGNLGGENSTFAEAKFMLISCSAFINYLIDAYKNIHS